MMQLRSHVQPSITIWDNSDTTRVTCRMFLEENDSVPYAALRYTAAEVRESLLLLLPYGRYV